MCRGIRRKKEKREKNRKREERERGKPNQRRRTREMKGKRKRKNGAEGKLMELYTSQRNTIITFRFILRSLLLTHKKRTHVH